MTPEEAQRLKELELVVEHLEAKVKELDLRVERYNRTSDGVWDSFMRIFDSAYAALEAKLTDRITTSEEQLSALQTRVDKLKG